MNYYYNEKNDNVISPKCADECLETIINFGHEYNDYSTTEDLKYLVDEIVSLARDARSYLRLNKIFSE